MKFLDHMAAAEGGLALGTCQLFPQLRLILRDGTRLEIGTKALDVLLVLAEANGNPVSKNDLISRVWPEQIVEENSLQAQISALRRALGADRNLITTEFGRGYRLAVSDPCEAGKSTFFPAIDMPDFPISVSPLVGREMELGELERIVVPGSLVTIAGTGGVGKSRLAIELGNRLGMKFADGVCLVELASLTDADLVYSTIASRLHLETVGFQKPTSSRTKIRNLRNLLVLDSCEQVLDRLAPVVRELLKAAPGLAILITSQEPLGIVGEQVYRLQPLGLPPKGTRTLGELHAFSSAELLMIRVHEADQTYLLDDDQASDICNICRQLDGIPLAIELAAARISLLGISTVVKGLSDRFKLLAGGRRTAVPRHQTLRATLEWSYNLLDDDEQKLLRRLGLFTGAFTLAAVGDVALPEFGDDWSVNDLVAGLASKSLIVIEPDATSTRFRLLESTRAFALEKLAPTGEFESISDRHAAFFRSRLNAATRDCRSLPSDEWLSAYQGDLNDIRFALDWTSSEGADPRAAAEILCASLPFWMQLSLLDECQGRVSGALKQLSCLGVLDPTLEMQLAAAQGACLAWIDGPTPKAEKAWARTLQLSQQTGNVEHRLSAHYGLWLYNLRIGQYEQSLFHASTLRTAGLENDDLQAELAGQRAAGVSLHFLARHEEAEDEIVGMLSRTEKGYQSFPFRFGVDQRSAALAFLARVVWIRGDAGRSTALAAQAVSEARRLRHASSLCCALLEGACTVAALGRDFSQLESSANEAIHVAENYNLGFWQAYGRSFIALKNALCEKSASSVENLRLCLQVLRSIHLDPAYSIFVAALAESLANLSHYDEARSIIDALITPLNASTDHWGLPEFLKIKSRISLLPDERDQYKREAEKMLILHGVSRSQEVSHHAQI